MRRCAWPIDELSIAYHDREWGAPVHDDRILFEFLILGGAQAGLSWSTILKKRENYRQAFDAFDPRIIAGYDERKVEELLINPGIIRNRLKIRSAIQNARVFLKVQEEPVQIVYRRFAFIHDTTEAVQCLSAAGKRITGLVKHVIDPLQGAGVEIGIDFPEFLKTLIHIVNGAFHGFRAGHGFHLSGCNPDIFQGLLQG